MDKAGGQGAKVPCPPASQGKAQAAIGPWAVDTCRDMHISVLGVATFGSPLGVHLTDFGQKDIGTMSSTEDPNWPAEEAPRGDNFDGNAWYDVYDGAGAGEG